MQSIATGKIATIVSPSEIAITCGEDTGIAVGDIVRVRKRIDIEDPDTHEPLGSVYVTSVSLTVTLVMERASVASVMDRVNANNVFAQIAMGGKVMKTLTTNFVEETSDTILVGIGQTVNVERSGSPVDQPT